MIELVFNLSDLPNMLANQLNIGLFPAQILLSVIFIFLVTLPFVFAKRGGSFTIELIVGFCMMGFCVAIGWLPSVFLLIVAMLLAVLFASKIRGMISGEG